MKKLMIYLIAIVMLLPVAVFGQGPHHKSKQAVRDYKRLSEGQKRKVMKDLKGKEGGYSGQERKTKRTLQSMEKGYKKQKQ